MRKSEIFGEKKNPKFSCDDFPFSLETLYRTPSLGMHYILTSRQTKVNLTLHLNLIIFHQNSSYRAALEKNKEKRSVRSVRCIRSSRNARSSRSARSSMSSWSSKSSRSIEDMIQSVPYQIISTLQSQKYAHNTRKPQYILQ